MKDEEKQEEQKNAVESIKRHLSDVARTILDFITLFHENKKRKVGLFYEVMHTIWEKVIVM